MKYDTLLLGNGFNMGLLNVLLQKNENINSKYNYVFNFYDFIDKLKVGKTDELLSIAIEVINKSKRRNVNIVLQEISKIFNVEDPIKIINNYESNYLMLAAKYTRALYVDNNYNVIKLITMIWNDENRIKVSEEEKKLEEMFGVKYDSKLSQYKQNFDRVTDDISFLYNTWNIVLDYYVAKNKELEEERKEYYHRIIDKYLIKCGNLLTTNYNCEMEKYYPQAQYLHGKFIAFSDVINENGEVVSGLKRNNSSKHPDFLFAMSSVHKHFAIQKRLYNCEFFVDSSRNYKNMLVYGLSFTRINDEKFNEFLGNCRKFDNVIDLHILKRIDELIIEEKLETATISAYDTKDKENYIAIIEDFKDNQEANIYSNFMNEKLKIVLESTL